MTGLVACITMALNATETAAHGRRCRPFKHICTDTVLTWVLCHRSRRGSKLSIFETHRHCDALTELILTHRAASRASLSFARNCGPKSAGFLTEQTCTVRVCVCVCVCLIVRLALRYPAIRLRTSVHYVLLRGRVLLHQRVAVSRS